MSKRDDADYEIEGFTKVWKVLEALEGVRWEPVTVAVIMERTEYSRDTVDRALKTLRMHGLAAVDGKKWTAGKRFVRVAESVCKKL